MLLAMVNFGLITLLAVSVFGVPVTGSYCALAVAAFFYCLAATGMGLLASAVTRSQIAALFIALVGTMIPTVQLSGMNDPVSSLQGAGRIMGELYPATHMFTISRGVFNKALGFSELAAAFWPLVLSVPVILVTAILLLKKQEH